VKGAEAREESGRAGLQATREQSRDNTREEQTSRQVGSEPGEMPGSRVKGKQGVERVNE
jgi:hypothetical protein